MSTGSTDETRGAGARIEVRELTRRFGSHTALDRLEFDIDRGETFGLLGANGAGKTTFIRMVTGYLVPTSGGLTVDGVSPASNPRAVQRHLGYVAETSRLYPELRVEAFLRFAGGARGLRGATLSEAVERTFTRFDLKDVSRRLIGNLSKGYQQRVSLAQAFLHEPSLLIVDEPTSGLDPLQQDEVRQVIAGLRGQRTIVLCTHDLGEARDLTERAAVLHEGRLMDVGATADLLGAGDPLALFRGQVRERAPNQVTGQAPDQSTDQAKRDAS
jgi:ABC-2 type transport system ATP-binding protein